MPKLIPPTSIAGGNRHNIILHVAQGPRDDAERLPQIAAEALTAARRARDMFDDMPPELIRRHRRLIDRISAEIQGRFVHRPLFRELARDFSLACDAWLVANGRDDTVEEPQRLVAEACEGSELVADIVSAECAIASLRARRAQA